MDLEAFERAMLEIEDALKKAVAEERPLEAGLVARLRSAIETYELCLAAIAEAKQDAVAFAEAFPGQELSGDWDSEALSCWKRAGEDATGTAWDAYSRTLSAEIERLSRGGK